MQTDITFIFVRLYGLELISIKNKLRTRTSVEEDLIVKLRVIVPDIDNLIMNKQLQFLKGNARF